MYLFHNTDRGIIYSDNTLRRRKYFDTFMGFICRNIYFWSFLRTFFLFSELIFVKLEWKSNGLDIWLKKKAERWKNPNKKQEFYVFSKLINAKDLKIKGNKD